MKQILLLALFLVLPMTLPGYTEQVSQNNTFVLNDTFAKKQPAMQKKQVAHILMKAGFPKHVVPVVTCLAEYESRFRPNAVNLNKNKTRDYGLLQINEIWLEACNTTPTNLAKPSENAKCAYKVYKTQGLTAWATYKVYKSVCHEYKI